MVKIKQVGKHFLWLPYTSDIQIKGKVVSFDFKGGQESLPFNRIHSIMFYGSVVPLSQKFLEECVKHKIPIVVHRRNMARAVWICSSTQTDVRDLLSEQILCRENAIKQKYIARKLIAAKFKSGKWLLESSTTDLTSRLDIKAIRNLEATQARKYWALYYEKLGHPDWNRRDSNPISKVLDATSKYISSILLRWILYHNLSPYHGYLHVQTEYPALVYDIFEPYRGYFDAVVFKTIRDLIALEADEKQWLPACINELKTFLDTRVYTDATRQIVTMSELMHGVVLALRSYLLGESSRFIVPIPGRPNGGRPKQVGYRLYGHQAGRTDFWAEARKVDKHVRNNYIRFDKS